MITKEQQRRIAAIRKTRNLTCGHDCGHAQLEHDAFDLGIADGEAGIEVCPFVDDGDGGLADAWATGQSVGYMATRGNRASA